MTDEQIAAMLAEIEQREQAATKGPWKNLPYEYYWCVDTTDPSQTTLIAELGSHRQDDAAFIAHARTDVPALVALARRLLRENDAYVRALMLDGWNRVSIQHLPDDIDDLDPPSPVTPSEPIQLDAEDSRAFAEAILNPREPSEDLRKTFAEYDDQIRPS